MLAEVVMSEKLLLKCLWLLLNTLGIWEWCEPHHFFAPNPSRFVPACVED